jgi:hypothetical protein
VLHHFLGTGGLDLLVVVSDCQQRQLREVEGTHREKKLRPYFFQCCIKTSLIPEPAFSLLAAARIESQADSQLNIVA